MTDFREYTMLQPKKLAEYVGFTEAEVRKLCQEYGMEFEDIKRWYDGYSFNRAKSVYSPNSVIQAISNQEVADEFKNAVEYSGLEDD